MRIRKLKFSSFLRRQESSKQSILWIPACAGIRALDRKQLFPARH